MVKVKDMMKTDIVSVQDSAPAMEAAVVMMENRVSSVVVKNGEETIGIITDKDFVHLASLGGNPRGVTSHMSTDLVTIAPGADLKEALDLMKEKDVRHLLVKEEGKIIGILSTKDINHSLASILASI
ncbi:CBS domain-containing protein [archaeon]|nr:CBS domain-containing protein [archaeon]